MNFIQSARDYLPDIADLPLILAGPILRQTKPTQVTVWLALKEARSLSLKIYGTSHNGSNIGHIVLQSQRKTVKLGKHLHLVAVTATAVGDISLQPGEIYAYDLDSDHPQEDRHSLLKNLAAETLSYFTHQLPTFALPPADLNQLKIVHGSCRKPHGGGLDSLAYLDHMIKDAANIATARPHQLFLTGDQIYGDDVADPILWLAQGVNELLLGWSEQLPLAQGQDTVLAKDLVPGSRTEIARQSGGMTAMLKDSPKKAKSHLFSFGEYAAIYLLAWSPVLMPSSFPRGKSLYHQSKQARRWSREIADTNSFIADLSQVRRALANIPVYTICDDHDVSDDWYLNREWCDRVLGKPLGKRIVQNGVLAYALFQAWGNTPEQFAVGTAGAKLLQLASDWLASAGQDSDLKAQCDRYLGIPQNDITTGLPLLEADQDVLILARDDQALNWHYTVSDSNHEVIVLDTRTWRGYSPGKDNGLEPPMLLSPRAFEQQLATPLRQSKSEVEATFVVLPTNLVALGIIDRIQQFELSRDRVFNSDVGDAWNFREDAFAQLLLNLCQQRDRVIILSGDIHYSCAVRLTHWDHDSLETSVLVQLTSSAIKNSELATRIIHTRLKSLFPESTQRWLGWEQPLKLEQIDSWQQNKARRKLHVEGQQFPDWQYRIEWCQREAAEPLPWSQSADCQHRLGNLWQRLLTKLLAWFWRNPWLQEGSEVVGRNNLSLVRFDWLSAKAVIQETYWHAPWKNATTVRSRYAVSLEPDALPPAPKVK